MRCSVEYMKKVKDKRSYYFKNNFQAVRANR